MTRGYYVLGEGGTRSVVKTAAALSGKLERGAWMDIFKKWVGKERPTHVHMINWSKVADYHRAGHTPRQAAQKYLEDLGQNIKESTEPHFVPLGEFHHEGQHHRYFKHDDPFAHKHGLPHLIELKPGEFHYGKVHDGVAHVAVGENAIGSPVLDRWEVLNHKLFHREEKMTPAMRTITPRHRMDSDPLNPHGSLKHQGKELDDWRKKHRGKILAAIGIGAGALGAAAIYNRMSTPQMESMGKKQITISYLPLSEDIGTSFNTPKKNKEKRPIDGKEGKIGEKPGEIRVNHGARPTIDDPESDTKQVDSPEVSSSSSKGYDKKYDTDDHNSQKAGNPHFKHTKQRDQDEKADQNAMNQKPDNQGFDNSQDKAENDNRSMKQREDQGRDGEGGLNGDDSGGKKLSKAAQKVKDIYNKKNGKGEPDEKLANVPNVGFDKEGNEVESTEDEPTGEGETINFNPTIDNITTQATGL